MVISSAVIVSIAVAAFVGVSFVQLKGDRPYEELIDQNEATIQQHQTRVLELERRQEVGCLNVNKTKSISVCFLLCQTIVFRTQESSMILISKI